MSQHHKQVRFCLTSSSFSLALCLRTVISRSTVTDSDSPWESGSLWSYPSGALQRTGWCHTALFVWQGRHLPLQYLYLPKKKSREEHDLEHCACIRRVKFLAACFNILTYLYEQVICSSCSDKVHTCNRAYPHAVCLLAIWIFLDIKSIKLVKQNPIPEIIS